MTGLEGLRLGDLTGESGIARKKKPQKVVFTPDKTLLKTKKPKLSLLKRKGTK